jgi:hypothetical protein
MTLHAQAQAGRLCMHIVAFKQQKFGDIEIIEESLESN